MGGFMSAVLRLLQERGGGFRGLSKSDDPAGITAPPLPLIIYMLKYSPKNGSKPKSNNRKSRTCANNNHSRFQVIFSSGG